MVELVVRKNDMRRTILWLVMVVVVATPLPTAAQPSAAVADLLRAITVRLDIESRETGRAGLCHGFVDVVRYDVAYIVTAKHCVEEINSARLSPTTVDRTLAVSVVYSNGGTGSNRNLFWDNNHDDLVVAATFDDRPPSLSGLCPNCRAYTVFVGQRISVLSILSAGGGPPVVSSGTLLSDQYGRYFVALPTSPGTSGSPVLDLRGNLVGIVVAGLVNRSAEAGWITDIVPGGLVFNLVRYAVEHTESPAPSSPASVPRPTQPPLPPCDGTTATREPSWRGLTCQ